jgi:hypothetical protein
MGKKNKDVLIRKYNGDEVVFSEEQFVSSLLHSGASSEHIDHVLRLLRPKIHSGITTKEIYRIAYTILRGDSRPTAARYHLKRAIMELGPSGFPFEKYIAALLAHQGYDTQTGILEQGKCVKHEVDVRAEKDHTLYFFECKYHNHPGSESDVKVPLYIHSRFNDIKAAYELKAEYKGKKYQGGVFTNTRFTSDAIAYGNCAGLWMQSWDYPFGNGLKEIIDQTRLYPITCMTTLSKTEKQFLLSKKIVLCSDLIANVKLLKSAGIVSPKMNRVQEEAKALCK